MMILIQQIPDEAQEYVFLKGSLGNCDANPLVRSLTFALTWSCAHTYNPLFNLGIAENKKNNLPKGTYLEAVNILTNSLDINLFTTYKTDK